MSDCTVSIPITLEVPLTVKPIVKSNPSECRTQENGGGTFDPLEKVVDLENDTKPKTIVVEKN